MFTIRKADTADCQLINKLAWQVFPETYKDILTPAQIDYMMDWMYSGRRRPRLSPGLRRVRSGGLCVRPARRRRPLPPPEDLCAALLPESTLRELPLPRGHQVHQGSTSRSLPYGTQREPPQPCPRLLPTHGHDEGT